MTIRDRIIDLLQRTPEGLDDDEIAQRLGLRQRQQANSRCRQLQAEGLVDRLGVGGKIRNFWREGAEVPVVPERNVAAGEEAWFWEGNVQDKVVSFLENQGWTIDFKADTRRRQQGKDVEATRGQGRLWISCKGYPVGTTRTNPPTQARHWFSHALFDMALWRGEDPTVGLAIGIPDFPTYRRLAGRVRWFKEATPFGYLWVSERTGITNE